MTDKITIILVIALLLDTVANVARIMAVEIAVKRQARMFKEQAIESDKRLKESAELVYSIVRMTIDGMDKDKSAP